MMDREPEVVQPPIHVALQTLRTALELYARHIVVLTAVSLLPALVRFAMFTGVAWLTGSLSGAVEAVVGVFRFVLLYVAFRLVWPEGFAGLQKDVQDNGRLRISRAELAWQLVLLAAMPLVLNIVASLAGRAAASEPAVQTALGYALKNLFVIPFWLVHLLIVVRRGLRG